MLIVLAAIKGWELQQADVSNAFLHCYLSEEVYMHVHVGYTKATDGQVCKLKQSLYGLKQAFREWNNELCTKLAQFGLTPLLIISFAR